MARRSRAQGSPTLAEQSALATAGQDQRFAVVRPSSSRAEYVQQVLRAEILTGKLPAGTPLLQDMIASRLGVSITPVREALRNLESIGLVEYEAHFGARVAAFSSGEIEEAYLLRATIEGLAARLAASTITSDELELLNRDLRALEEGQRRQDAQAMASAAREFHAHIASVGGKTMIIRHLRLIWDSHPIPIEDSLWSQPDMAAEGIRWYSRLLELIGAGDADGAEQHMIEQVRLAAIARERVRAEAK